MSGDPLTFALLFLRLGKHTAKFTKNRREGR